ICMLAGARSTTATKSSAKASSVSSSAASMTRIASPVDASSVLRRAAVGGQSSSVRSVILATRRPVCSAAHWSTSTVLPQPAPDDVGFSVDVLQVGFDGIEGNAQALGDLGVRLPAREMHEHHVLAIGELFGEALDGLGPAGGDRPLDERPQERSRGGAVEGTGRAQRVRAV